MSGQKDGDDKTDGEKDNPHGFAMDAEVFAVGRWNGYEFTTADLISIAESFSKLKDFLKVPLKMGHNDEQPMTDGQPALGWVDDVWVDGDKLKARFSDVPDLVYNAMKRKLYRNVSIELDVDVEHKGTHYPFVLSGVALLGADIPAVSTLEDLTHYMSRGADFRAGRRAMFSAVAGKLTGANDMDVKELAEKVSALTASVEKIGSERAALATENAELKAKVEKYEKDAQAAAERAEKEKIVAKRTEATKLFDDAVKANAITPAQRTSFSKLLRIDDDKAVSTLDLDEVKALCKTKAASFSKGTAKSGEHEDEDERPAAEIVIEKCREIIAKGEAKHIMEAQQVLFRRDPALGRRYINGQEA